jgi:hypothetical protein
MVIAKRHCMLHNKMEEVKTIDAVAAMRMHIEILTAQEQPDCLDDVVKRKYENVFSAILHIDDLPTNIYCHIQLKDASKTIKTWSYSTTCKYKEAWAKLIKQHLDAGRICPSNSTHTSPAFLVPKADMVVLPHWVNDYRALNANTVMDSHPLPCIDDILADCAKGKVWSIINMMNSFFQTRVHPNNVHLTAVTSSMNG